MSRHQTSRPHGHLAVLIGALLLSVAGCSDGRPEVSELADGLTTGTSLFPVAEQQAECAAEVLRDSDLDDDLLTAIAESDTEHEISPDDASTLATLQVEVLETCGT
jgi:hypothetical protein